MMLLAALLLLEPMQALELREQWAALPSYATACKLEHLAYARVTYLEAYQPLYQHDLNYSERLHAARQRYRAWATLRQLHEDGDSWRCRVKLFAELEAQCGSPPRLPIP